MGRGKRRAAPGLDAAVAARAGGGNSLPLSDGSRERRTPALLQRALELSDDERRSVEQQRRVSALLPYFGSAYGLGQALDLDERLIQSWLEQAAAPDDEDVQAIDALLEVARTVDEWSGGPLQTGDWLRTPHYLIPDAGGRQWSLPGRSLRERPDLRRQVLDAAYDDFQDGAREHRKMIELKGYTLLPDGKTASPLGLDQGSVGLSPYFHRPLRDPSRPTLAEPARR